MRSRGSSPRLYIDETRIVAAIKMFGVMELGCERIGLGLRVVNLSFTIRIEGHLIESGNCCAHCIRLDLFNDTFST